MWWKADTNNFLAEDCYGCQLETRRPAGDGKIAGRRRGQCGRSEGALDWGWSGQSVGRSVGMEEGAIVPASLHTGMDNWMDGCCVLRQQTAVLSNA